MRKYGCMLAVVAFFGAIALAMSGCAGWETPLDRWNKKPDPPENVYSHETLRASGDFGGDALVCGIRYKNGGPKLTVALVFMRLKPYFLLL